MRFKSKSAILFMLAAIGTLGYFTWHGLHGSRGVERVAELRLKVERLEGELAQLKEQRLALERRVVLLRPESIDPDMLDEEARALLGFVHENDRSIPLDRSGGVAAFAE
ncbi:FtsB family cell division protein [Rhodoligotrophos ferricapiens]|uniref:FtsB family cell division protein n=1 Tax=Rhodoligotrophos ferricapiens TaxID=3069264 RepID=UPI00315CB147